MRQGTSDIGMTKVLEPVVVREVVPDTGLQVVHIACNEVYFKRVQGTRRRGSPQPAMSGNPLCRPQQLRDLGER